MSKKVLGRGLSTLLPSRPQTSPAVVTSETEATPIQHPAELALDAISPNPFQPRKHFDEIALAELAQSIRTEGIIQPLVVRRVGDEYQLIAGERRWRASSLAGIKRVPVYVQEMPDDRMLEVALIENIQRENLNAIEESRAFARLSEELGLSHEEIGQRTGKDRATISNSIRLLQLPEYVQKLIAERRLSAGHARALLKLSDADQMREMARKAIDGDWSVRRLEQLTANPQNVPAVASEPPTRDPNVSAAIEEHERVLGTRVRIVERRGRGHFEIEFYSADDQDRIYSLLTSNQ